MLNIDELTRQVLAAWRRFGWLPEWAVVALALAAAVAIGWLAHAVTFNVARRIARRRDPFWRGAVERARIKLLVLVMLGAVALGVTASPLDPAPSETIRQVVLFLAILVVGWITAGIVSMAAAVHLRHFDIALEDNLIARKHLTQTRVLQRVSRVLIALISLGLAFMTVGGFREWGVSLLASAGVIGIIAGLALQPLLTNVIAGIQIALTQPIRMDDAIMVEGEFGNVEEITTTYVVVRLWDWRRLVLPLTYFITTPFQNWTRETSRLISATLLYADFEAPIERLRFAFQQIVGASPHWDGDVQSLQVTEVNERTVQIRCLASARNSGVAFDLRCEIREKMLAFMRDECREALPQDRMDIHLNRRTSGAGSD